MIFCHVSVFGRAFFMAYNNKKFPKDTSLWGVCYFVDVSTILDQRA